jgi:hypothetical protein
MNRTISYQDLAAVFRRKFAQSDAYGLQCALQDCYEVLRIHEHEPASSEYVRKVWCEIDAIRDRQMQIRHNVRELEEMRAFP